MRISLPSFGLLLVLASAPLGCASNIAIGFPVGAGRHCVTTASIGTNAFASDTTCVGNLMADCLDRYGDMGGEEVALCRHLVATHARAEEDRVVYAQPVRAYYTQPLVIPQGYYGPGRHHLYRATPTYHLNHRRHHHWRR